MVVSNEVSVKEMIPTRQKDMMYRMIVSQLFYDGHQHIALSISTALQMVGSCPPSDRLFNIVQTGLILEEERTSESNRITKDFALPGIGIDLESQSDIDYPYVVEKVSPDLSGYETAYVTSHKAACRCAAFSTNGDLLATGSEDTSIKILDTDRMLAKSLNHEQGTDRVGQDNHPVIRTLYDHQAEVTTLAFHPSGQQLVSGSRDFTIKIFEYTKPSVKRALKNESAEIRDLCIHPSGDYLLVGTDHHALRLYDYHTFQCFVSPIATDQHKKSINSVAFSSDGKMYATASDDGDLRLWDGVSGRCFSCFEKAHAGESVCSVQFSRNNKYLVTSGRDSMVKLWEVATSRCLIAYTGAGSTGKQLHSSRACFNHTEDYIIYNDECTTSLCVWDSRNADRQRLLSLGHNGFVRYIAHSPSSPAMVTCSDDFRARFWFKRNDLSI